METWEVKTPPPSLVGTQLTPQEPFRQYARPSYCSQHKATKPLAIEVRFQGAAGKRQIAPPSALLMTPPVDVREGLVVEREAAEEDLGTLIITNVLVINTVVKRRICFSLKLGDKCYGGVADGGEDGGEGVIFKFTFCS
ncbi:phosphoribosylformylglycinamidine synthase [Babesia caballi]|uniref:Phosphoribosylformylglycinamidine synthase n=1 Tax=Babesia caballi TaxID=5871 RepID=A0AAV4LXW8_BABCB|nr:phosphoribosylformylglycinamidine synthase [Babesia caballi]